MRHISPSSSRPGSRRCGRWGVPAEAADDLLRRADEPGRLRCGLVKKKDPL